MGVLRELVRKELGVDTYVKINPNLTSVSATAQKMLNNNPDRVAFVAINLGSNPIMIAPDESVSSTYGIRLDANGGSLSMYYKEDFELVGFEYWAITTTGTSTLYTIEVIAR